MQCSQNPLNIVKYQNDKEVFLFLDPLAVSQFMNIDGTGSATLLSFLIRLSLLLGDGRFHEDITNLPPN